MLYKDSLKEEILATLEKRVVSISDCIVALVNEGYVPNKNKDTILKWSGILIHAYQNVNILSAEQQNKLDNLFNKVISL